MRRLLALLAFGLSAVCLLLCLAVALDGFGLTAGVLPVLRSANGVTPMGALVLLACVPLALIFLWAGASLWGRAP